MRMPGGENALVDPRKLIEYCLNPSHPEGKHKARVFRSALGITAKDFEVLRQRLLEAARDCEVTQQSQSDYGVRYVIDFAMVHFTRAAKIRSGWILETGSSVPRLVTCFIVSEGGPRPDV